MSDPNIADGAVSMFGNDDAPKNTKNSVFTYSENTHTHDGTVAPPGRSGLGIDCSELANQAVLSAGYNVPYLATPQIYEGGHLTPAGAKYYETVPTNELQKGDLVLFKGHVGVVESYDSKTGDGKFYGSQSKTGPASTEFNTNDAGLYWGRADKGEPVLTGLKPKAETYDPAGAAATLQPILEKRAQALNQLQHDQPALAADVQKTLTGNQQVLDNLEAGRPGPAKVQGQTGDQPPLTKSSRLDEPDHPGNGLFTQARDRVHALDTQLGRTPDTRSENLAGAVTVAALSAGITRIDHVQPDNIDGSKMFVAQNTSPLKTVAELPTMQGMNTPLEQSSAQYRQIAERQTQAQAQQQVQTQSQHQEAAPQQTAQAMQIKQLG